MSMSVLISDKSVPFASSLAGALRGHNASVALLGGIADDAGSRKKDPSDPSALREIPWNRASDLSARTVLLETRNSFVTLDQAVLVFDTPAFAERLSPAAEKTSVPDRMGPAAVIDEYIKGYLLLAGEVLSLFAKQKKGRIAFVVRGQPASGTSAGGHPVAGTLSPTPGIPLAVAEAAFTRLAEETAASIAASGLAPVQSLLVKLDGVGDGEAAAWLVEQLLQQNVPRNQGRWIKAGSKGLLSLL